MFRTSLCLIALCGAVTVLAAPNVRATLTKAKRSEDTIDNAVIGSTGRSPDFIPTYKINHGNAFDEKPNIIFLLADDLGWNDVSWHNEEVVAPNMKALLDEGLELDSIYVQNVCSPSRHATMTGKYPYHSGMSHGVILEDAPDCSPLSDEFMPTALKPLGYNTHMLGKWHLGMCDWKCTPTYRGFDTFYGFYQGYIDHYTHMIGGGHDWRDQEEDVRSNDGIFATTLLTDRALEVLDKEAENQTEPFFMYFAYNNAHVPLQAPQRFVELYKDANMTEDRKIYLGLVSSMDDSIGQLVQKLKDTGLYENTLIIFSADNGGESPAGNNFPLRGGKGSLFEGAMRASAFVHSPLLPLTKGTKTTELMHTTDWLPTLLTLAGGEPGSGLDGVDQSDILVKGGESKRDMIVHNIDTTSPQMLGHAAVRKGDWKLISGNVGYTDGRDGQYEHPWNLEAYAEWIPKSKRHYAMTPEEVEKMVGFINNIEGNPMLFNIKDDPNEYEDVAADYPEIVAELEAIIAEAKKTLVEIDPADMVRSPEADPSLPQNGGSWTPGWCDKSVEE